MKTTLEHLPEYKREELARVVETVLASGKIEMLILFGSHARGDWVEDRRVEGNAIIEYRSDYDIYALVRVAKHCDRLLLEPSLRDRFDRISRTPVSLIADTVKHFNHALERGRYFYVDVAKEGILLHDSGKYPISEPRELTREERLEEVTADYDYWFAKAQRFNKNYQFNFDDEDFVLASFMLHQTVEHCTTTALLVLTSYTPKGHDIAQRLKHCTAIDRRFADAFPVQAPDDKRRFDLLCKAYIGARYKKDFAVDRSDLERLATHVQALLDLTRDVCQARVHALAG